MNDQETRDIAVKAEANISAHLADCASFRGRIEKSIEGLFATMQEQNTKLNRQTWIIGMITGVWLTVQWMVDHLSVITKVLHP